MWDEFNLEHIKKHGVKRKEVEEASRRVIYHRKTYQKRFLVVGYASKRLVSFVVKRKESTIYYLVTARDAERKERRKVYEKEKKQNSKF